MQIIYEIQPKKVDDSSNEIDLEQYSIVRDYTSVVEFSDNVADGDKYITLPSVVNQKIIEFISNVGVYFAFYDSGTLVKEFTNCKNIILQADIDYTFKMKNKSGSDAEIVWRLFI